MSVTSEEATIAAFDTALNELLKLRPSVKRPVLMERLNWLLEKGEVIVGFKIY